MLDNLICIYHIEFFVKINIKDVSLNKFNTSMVSTELTPS